MCLAATSQGEIVCSFADRSCLELMDYSGSSVRKIQPPPEVKNWIPTLVCCREGETFVVNGCVYDKAGWLKYNGEPKCIFRYSAKGDYLGCVTTDVRNPMGIALSQNGMVLFVAERDDQLVKIFHRA